MTQAEREAKNAAWRKWYAENQEMMLEYYKDRYARRIDQETPEDREKRLARQRDAQARYAQKYAGTISDKRKNTRKKRCSKCLDPRKPGEKLYIRKARTGRIIGRYCGKCRAKKGL